jgi:hypothetical protein
MAGFVCAFAEPEEVVGEHDIYGCCVAAAAAAFAVKTEEVCQCLTY